MIKLTQDQDRECMWLGDVLESCITIEQCKTFHHWMMKRLGRAEQGTPYFAVLNMLAGGAVGKSY